MSFDHSFLETHLPAYLSQPLKDGILRELKNYKYLYDFYFNPVASQAIQGDAWTGLDVFNIQSGDRKTVRGIIISNSCDIDPTNARDVSPNLSFCPLIKLSSYAHALATAGLEKENIDRKIATIKQQHITNIMYFPEGSGLEDEHIVDFGNTQSIPLSYFVEKKDRKRIFSLNQASFYLFILKLSIHFCRLHEGINRTSQPSP